MGRTKEQQREYMRDYRARKKAEAFAVGVDFGVRAVAAAENWDRARAEKQIARLEEEVRHLKEELAKRHSLGVRSAGAPQTLIESDVRFNSRPFTPVPKRHG